MHRRGASLAGMVVASLLLFAVGITVAANAIGNLIGSLDVNLNCKGTTGGLSPPPPTASRSLTLRRRL